MFAIVTDSGVYFTRQQAERLGIHVLPMLYSVNGRSFTEGYTDENGRYKERIAQQKDLHTAQVPSASFLNTFRELLQGGSEVLCVTMSSRLSGTYSSAVMAAKELNTDRILVVDSQAVSGSLQFMMEKAAELSRQNYSLQEAAEALKKMRDQVGTVFSVDDMEALRRSGRLGFVRQSVGTMLNLRPILFLRDGTVVSSGVVRGAHAQRAALLNSVPDCAIRIKVLYIEKQAEAQVLQEALQGRTDREIEIGEVGPVLAIHLGLHAIGIAWMCESQKKEFHQS